MPYPTLHLSARGREGQVEALREDLAALRAEHAASEHSLQAALPPPPPPRTKWTRRVTPPY